MRSIYRLLSATAARCPQRTALSYRGEQMGYAELKEKVDAFGTGLQPLMEARFDRIAIFLDKNVEFVVSFFAAAARGAIVVPINPQLKPQQVGHILRDSGARVLITTPTRAQALRGELPDALQVVLCGGNREIETGNFHFDDLMEPPQPLRDASIDGDPVAILYTSGSTGLPKGVVVSHRNLVSGAQAVNEYLGIGEEDVILSVLPFSFDAGLSQLTTAVAAGARIVLLNYLTPSEVPRVCAQERVTAITAVPPLWVQMSGADWTPEARSRIRVFANTGGHMPRPLLDQLRTLFPGARPFLMYGLTEAFRSTFLDPSQVDQRPDSIGKAIPNAEILVLRPDGTECGPEEAGELVHRGSCVTLGYWNSPDNTQHRFRPLPSRINAALLQEMGVWSGDIVRKDAEGFLYFIGRSDDMIKSSGYRISPTEVEGVLYASGMVREVAVIGIPHQHLGQTIMAVLVPTADPFDSRALTAYCKTRLPSYMLPSKIVPVPALPRNPNGKVDRKSLAAQYAGAEPQAVAVSR